MRASNNTPPDTIVALSTPPGRGGVAVVRVSGPLVEKIAQSILGQLPKPRYATYLSFLDTSQQPIDQGLALYFPAPHSFTGENVLELHGHGGFAVTDCLIRCIIANGARLARPGEFSERAFLNNKIDLAQAEAIADLIDASSEQAARASLRSLQGEFSKKINIILESLIQLRMYVEAAIDFAEEEIDFLADSQVGKKLSDIIQEIEQLQASAIQGSLLRDGITAVIAGPPNAGKSTLLNCLSGKDAAIVTDIPGTTRDVLREYITIDGMPMHIIDTAGLRHSTDIVEQEGIRRTHQEIEKADIILFITDTSCPDEIKIDFQLPRHAVLITVHNKIDLTKEAARIAPENTIYLSAKNNLGIDLLKELIKSCVGFKNYSEGSFSARRRHLDAISRAYQFLQTGQQQLHDYRAGELLAEDLRQAQLALSEITGEFSSDDLLGRIFSSFCIGK